MGLPLPPIATHWKGTLFINVKGDSPSGWSETFSLIAATYAGAIASLEAIWEARRPSLADDCILEYAYVSDMAFAGDSLPFIPAAGHFLGTYTGTDVHTLKPWNVVLARFQAGPRYRATRPIRGVPNDQDLSTFTPTPGGAYHTALTAYCNAIKLNANLRIKIQPTDPNHDDGQFRTISEFFILRWSERADGRPFGLRRGRLLKRAPVF